MFKDYLLQNWGLILILIAFAVTINITIYQDKKTTSRMLILIISVFILSISVFTEFAVDLSKLRVLRMVLMAIRYSATPFIISQISYTLVKKQRWFIFIPAIVLTVIDVVSIFTGIVFTINEDNSFERGFLGYLPFVVAGAYCIFLIYMLFRRSNKHLMEIIPIIYLSFALCSGIIMPFIFGSKYSEIFCTTIAIALYVYYVFSIFQLSKKDALTGLLNRQAFNTDINRNPEDINAIVSIDMNGLKKINDTQGHVAGDDALLTIALCFNRSLRRNQFCYRTGGDEFVIVCRKNTENDVIHLIERIKNYVSETKYTCAIGYCFSNENNKSPEDMLKKSDENMYSAKADFYAELKKR